MCFTGLFLMGRISSLGILYKHFKESYKVLSTAVSRCGSKYMCILYSVCANMHTL